MLGMPFHLLDLAALREGYLQAGDIRQHDATIDKTEATQGRRVDWHGGTSAAMWLTHWEGSDNQTVALMRL